jgi:hypothetical protein
MFARYATLAYGGQKRPVPLEKKQQIVKLSFSETLRASIVVDF